MKPKSYRKKSTPKDTQILARQGPSNAGQIVQNVLTELPDLLAVAVVGVQTGACLAAHTNDASIAPATAAVFNAEVIRQKQKALTALALLDERIEDILITLSTQLHLMKLAPDGHEFIYLVVNAQSTNLGMAREVLRVQAEQLG